MGKPKVLYIVGYGHSGSTLLNLILGSARKCFAVGELAFLKNRYYTLDNKGRKRDSRELLCSCGNTFQDCPFWRAVGRKVTINDLYWFQGDVKENFLLSGYLLFSLNKHSFQKYKKREKYLYTTLLEQAQEKEGKEVECIVDSSKNLKRLLYLHGSGAVDLYVLHLVRDGRGVIHSMEKLGQSWVKTYWGWLITNIATRQFLKRKLLPHRYITLSYDEFAQNPSLYLQRINEKFGIDVDTSHYIKAVNNTLYHNFAGNKIRDKKLSTIKYDQTWRKNFSIGKQKLLTVMTYLPNTLWVYRKDQRK